ENFYLSNLDGNSRVIGILDEVSVWDRVLSAGEISDYYDRLNTALTNQSTVPLSFNARGAPTEMYVTATAGCASGGSWETYEETVDFPLLNLNGSNTIYVKFRDALGNESACVNDTIIHDDTKPTVTIARNVGQDALST